MLYIIEYVKLIINLWNVTDTQDNQNLPYSISHYFLVGHQKITANDFTSFKKKKHLHLKSGMRGFFKKMFLELSKTCVYKIVDKNNRLDCTRRRQIGCDINQTWLPASSKAGAVLFSLSVSPSAIVPFFPFYLTCLKIYLFLPSSASFPAAGADLAPTISQISSWALSSAPSSERTRLGSRDCRAGARQVPASRGGRSARLRPHSPDSGPSVFLIINYQSPLCTFHYFIFTTIVLNY